ncbi:hypothetical protein [Streptacidiphilus anmyonensis]|uniref:hypothetical protein n=1 Tax=Streptacidiphilus anmyonensis TaxID=405782 RepID=UPI0005AA6058|nr:hypothetical protein [Streptacidiphilus anmyonensis]
MAAGSAYWAGVIRKADKESPKRGFERRADRLRSVLQHVDPVVATRAWREAGDALQTLLNRYDR